MRNLIAVAAFMLAGPAMAAEKEEFHVKNASGLVELCSVPADHPHHVNAREFCHGYLVGAYQYYDATEPASDRFVCAPDPRPSLGDVMDGYVAWAKTHPQHMSERAADALFRYLAEAYPCKK